MDGANRIRVAGEDCFAQALDVILDVTVDVEMEMNYVFYRIKRGDLGRDLGLDLVRGIGRRLHNLQQGAR